MAIAELKNELAELQQEATKSFGEAANAVDLEAVRLEFFGQSGKLTKVLRQLGQLAKEERPAAGQLANEAKAAIQKSFEQAQKIIYDVELAKKLSGEVLDFTLPGLLTPVGHCHPLTQISDQITQIFNGMGFSVAQ